MCHYYGIHQFVKLAQYQVYTELGCAVLGWAGLQAFKSNLQNQHSL
jgi:hypothetical protein